MKNLQARIGLMLIFSLTFGFGWAQTINGTVYSVLNLGSIDYSYILDPEQGVFYKTSAYEAGLLTLESPVTLTVDPNIQNAFNIKVTENSSEVITCFATKIQKETFDLPITSIYGMPVLENDILFFTDIKHFDEFYAILNDFSTSPYEEQRDLLRLFEKQFPSFKSFSTHLELKYNWEEGEFTEEEVVNRYKIDFFQDYLIKSLCNEYAEIGIGNEVHTMFRDEKTDQCITILVPKENETLIRDKRLVSFPDLELYSQIHELDIYYGGTESSGEKSQITYVLGKDQNNFDIELTYQDGGEANNVDCKIYDKTFRVGIVRYCDNMSLIQVNNYSGSVTINWGDGSSSTHDLPDMTGTNQSNSSYVTPTHTYAAMGTYTITYIINFTTEHPTSQNHTFNGDPTSVIVGSACAEKSVNAPSQRIWIDGTYSMLSDAWINNWVGYKCVGSATEAWRKKNNGNLVKENGNIQSTITAVYRNDDCSQFESAYEHDSKYGKHVQTIVTKWWRRFDVQNGDTYSNHYYERNNSIVQTSIPLNPCN